MPSLRGKFLSCLECSVSISVKKTRDLSRKRFCSRICKRTYYSKLRPTEFWTKVEKTDTCWLWKAGRYASGYGQFRRRRAHRVAWELTYGSIPLGKKILHDCDIKRCVNPNHLFLGTSVDNTQDMLKKGRHNPPQGTCNGQAKLTEEEVKRIRQLREQGYPLQSLSEMFEVSKSRISKISRNLAWRHVHS